MSRSITLAPRLLSQGQAAAYCGLSAPTFKSVCPVIPIKIRTRVLYDREEIDRWIDSRATTQPDLLTGSKWLERLDGAGANKGN